ncbi:MAG: baseplate J/gp47 family protein [Sneathiella sp.]
MVDTGFERPALTDLIDIATNSVNVNLVGADASLRRSVLNVLVTVLSGQTHGLYDFQKHISRQAIVDTATSDSLSRWGRVWQIERKPATFAEGLVEFTGEEGQVVFAGTEFRRNDDHIFTAAESAQVSGGVGTAMVKSNIIGDTGNTAPGQAISLMAPIAGISSACTVSSTGITGGADVEDDALLLGRILERIQTPPHGGASFDYIKWALEIPGITRAWVYPKEQGLGTVVVRFMMDSTYENGFPQSGDVQNAQAYIEADTRRPVTADVTVVAPVPHPVDIEIEDLSPDTIEVRNELEAELKDLFVRVSAPGKTLPVSKLWEAVAIAAGEDSHRIASPAADVVLPIGELATLGVVSYSQGGG